MLYEAPAMSFANLIRPRDSLRARLTFWYVSALTLALSAFAALLYASLSRTLYQHHDHELLADGDRIAHLLSSTTLSEEAVATALRGAEGLPPFLMVRDGSGELIYRSPLLQVAEPSIGHHEVLIHAAAKATTATEFFTVTLERTGLVRFICTPISGPSAAYVQIGNPLGDVPETLRAVALASAVLVPVVIVLTSFGGWLVAGRALAPIESIDRTLSKRVEVRPADRELQGLVRTINGLLARLERAFQDLRSFTTDASHQLQTPLSVMKSTIEFARRTPAEKDIPLLLDDLEEEVTDMSRVVADLQTLSLADAELQPTHRAPVDFSTLCVDAAEIIAALGEPRSVIVQADVSPDVQVVGDVHKLKQVLLNLGDNAVKYTSAGGHVSFHLRQEDGHALLQVSDTGIGIAADELPRIFDRFYRAPSVNGGARGAGLGLAIAQRVVEVHHGSIDVKSSLGLGTTFTVRLPAC
jgi:signal transduction histidine kinase